MQELIGQRVKVILNTTFGVVSTVGVVLKVENHFILLKQTFPKNEPIYISLFTIKTITLLQEV